MTTQVGFQPPGAFIKHLARSGFKQNRPVSPTADFETYHLDLTPLKLNVGFFVPFHISKRLSGHKVLNADQLSEIRPEVERVTPFPNRFSILTVGGKLTGLKPELMDDLKKSNIAIIDRTTIDAILATDDFENKAHLLSTALVRFLGRETLSPYVSGRPAFGGRFFGRASIMKKLLPGSQNFTLIGNRRIGKTSILQELKERLKLQGFKTAEIYGATCNSTVDVIWTLLTELDEFREADHIIIEPHRARNLPSYLHSIVEAKKAPIAVFIDELDHILEFDAEQNDQVMHLLRSAFHNRDDCRIFLAGFRKVMQARQSLSTPPFNFTSLLDLPLFSREETYEMIKTPLYRMGIDLSNSDLPESIYRETGGHPELIQIFCTEIIRVIEKSRRVPSAGDLLAEVFNTEEYKQKVLGTFLANTNAYEELLCYLLIADAAQSENPTDYEFSPLEVDRVLKNVNISLGIREITGITTNLKASGIVAPIGGSFERYRFAAPQLVNYCIELKLDFCIQKALERVEASPEGILGLWSEPDERDRTQSFPRS